MKRVNFSILTLLGVMTAPAISAQADESCLVGEWQSQRESYVATAEAQDKLGLVVTAGGGGLTIALAESNRAHLTYTDYVVVRKMQRDTSYIEMEMTFNGEVDGGFMINQATGNLMIRTLAEIEISVRQRRPDQPWVNAGKDEQKPPHDQDGLIFDCNDDELVLTKEEHGQFGAKYQGRFKRIG